MVYGDGGVSCEGGHEQGVSVSVSVSGSRSVCCSDSGDGGW